MEHIPLQQGEIVEAIAQYIEKQHPTKTFEQVKLYGDNGYFSALVQVSNKQDNGREETETGIKED